MHIRWLSDALCAVNDATPTGRSSEDSAANSDTPIALSTPRRHWSGQPPSASPCSVESAGVSMSLANLLGTPWDAQPALPYKEALTRRGRRVASLAKLLGAASSCRRHGSFSFVLCRSFSFVLCRLRLRLRPRLRLRADCQ